MINISIDLAKIDKSRIKPGKNGEKYYSLTVDRKKEVDKFGNDHSVYQTPTKEEREAKANKVYIGSGKEFVFKQQGSTPPNQNIPVHSSAHTTNGGSGYVSAPMHPNGESIDDLPF